MMSPSVLHLEDRYMAFGLVSPVPPHIPSQLVEDSLCRSLFLLLRSDNIELFTTALRVLYLMFQACRSRLKFQLSHMLTILTEASYDAIYWGTLPFRKTRTLEER
jgi:hypothetical protein